MSVWIRQYSQKSLGATFLHSLPFDLSSFLPWAQGLLGTARSQLTAWRFCSSWPGRRYQAQVELVSWLWGCQSAVGVFKSISILPSHCSSVLLGFHCRDRFKQKVGTGQNSRQKHNLFGIYLRLILFTHSQFPSKAGDLSLFLITWRDKRAHISLSFSWKFCLSFCISVLGLVLFCFFPRNWNCQANNFEFLANLPRFTVPGEDFPTTSVTTTFLFFSITFCLATS